jgi:hypothetical protein
VQCSFEHCVQIGMFKCCVQIGMFKCGWNQSRFDEMTYDALRDMVGRLNQVIRYVKIVVCFYGTPVIAISFTPISEVNFNLNILLWCYVLSKEFGYKCQ